MASFGYLKILWGYGSCKNVGDLGKRRQAFTYEEEATLIRNTKPFAHFIDPDDPSSSIRKYAKTNPRFLYKEWSTAA